MPPVFFALAQWRGLPNNGQWPGCRDGNSKLGLSPRWDNSWRGGHAPGEHQEISGVSAQLETAARAYQTGCAAAAARTISPLPNRTIINNP